MMALRTRWLPVGLLWLALWSAHAWAAGEPYQRHTEAGSEA